MLKRRDPLRKWLALDRRLKADARRLEDRRQETPPALTQKHELPATDPVAREARRLLRGE